MIPIEVPERAKTPWIRSVNMLLHPNGSHMEEGFSWTLEHDGGHHVLSEAGIGPVITWGDIPRHSDRLCSKYANPTVTLHRREPNPLPLEMPRSHPGLQIRRCA